MSVFTPIDDSASTEGAIVSTEVFSQIAANLAYLMDSMPVGSEIIVLTGFPGVPTPNPAVWQPCDGSLITNQNSPMRNQHTPDKNSTARYCKGSSVGTTGATGGTMTKSFAHNHGGRTGVYGPNAQVENEDVFNESIAHDHVIFSDLGSHNVEPVHIKLNHYIKIT